MYEKTNKQTKRKLHKFVYGHKKNKEGMLNPSMKPSEGVTKNNNYIVVIAKETQKKKLT